MKLQGIDEKYAIYGTLFSLTNRIQTVGDKEFTDITLKQQFLMIGVSMFQEPPTLKEVGDLIGCSYQNIKRMADHLEKAGYLKIIQDVEDKRKLRLYVTEKMDQLAEESGDKREQFMAQLYTDITKEDMLVTLRTLMKMDQNLGGVIE